VGLNTENAGALIGSANPNAGNKHTVEVLIGTFVASVGRDVKQGEVVTVSNDDYRFLKPYGYVKEAVEAVEAEVVETEDTEDTEDSAPKMPKGRRR